MNGAFRYEPLPIFGDRIGNIRAWWMRCQATEADGFLVTSWEANRLSLETTTVVDAATATLWLEPEITDATTFLARGLARVFRPKNAQTLARLLLAGDEHPFAGYARWQINDRWDTFAGQESVKPYQAEERFFTRVRNLAPWPRAFAASLEFRCYVAKRDVFVRQMARSVFKLRRLFSSGKSSELVALFGQMHRSALLFREDIRAGKKSARTMWRITRDTAITGPNEIMIAADAVRLASLEKWLKRAGRKPALILEANPVTGFWQLQFTVHNFAPAVQRVSVQQQEADGTWRELAGRHTIEFRATAARPRTKIHREFTVPVDSPDAKLRILAGGVGQVAISHLLLTNGVEVRREARFRLKKILGHRSPRQGFPDLNRPPPVLTVRCK